MASLIPLILLLGVMYLLLIRPQQRRVRQHQAVVSNLDVGDEVITAGGVFGTIRSIDDTTVVLRVSDGVDVRFLRGAISQRVTDADDDADDDYDDAHYDDADHHDLDDDADDDVGGEWPDDGQRAGSSGGEGP